MSEHMSMDAMVRSWPHRGCDEPIREIYEYPVCSIAHQMALAAHAELPAGMSIADNYEAQQKLHRRAAITHVFASGKIIFVFREPIEGLSAIVCRPDGDTVHPRWG